MCQLTRTEIEGHVKDRAARDSHALHYCNKTLLFRIMMTRILEGTARCHHAHHEFLIYNHAWTSTHTQHQPAGPGASKINNVLIHPQHTKHLTIDFHPEQYFRLRDWPTPLTPLTSLTSSALSPSAAYGEHYYSAASAPPAADTVGRAQSMACTQPAGVSPLARWASAAAPSSSRACK